MAVKPWLGAVAVAAAMLVAPGAAAADDGSSLIQFKLPDKDAIEKLVSLGTDLDHGILPAEDGGILVSAVVTPEERAVLEAMGYPAVAVIHGPDDAEKLRAQREAALAQKKAALDALRTNAAGVKGASAAPGTVRAQRAEYFENYAGRFLSIEGTTTEATVTGNQYTGPQLTAAWYDGDGNEIGTANLQALLDTDVTPRYYMYHRTLVRLGNVGDGGMPASVKIASSTGDVDELPVREWVSNDGADHPDGFIEDFNTHYVLPREAYAKLRELANEFPNIAQVYDLPHKTNGYRRKAQAVLGVATPYTGQTSIASADQSRAVVLTSIAYGHQGGNQLRASLVDPGEPDQPLTVSVSGNTITVSLATDDQGAITSTAAQVVDAINADAAASTLVTASKYRTNAGAGVVLPTATTALRDFLSAPTSVSREPQTVQMLRIGAQRDGSKVGVFIYCQEHAREWATPLVCLETAERLVRNYATDDETKAIVDGLDIFIIPSINPDGATYSMYDNAAQRRNLTNHCASNPTGNNDPAARHSWGVDINRNFSVGSFFDGYVGASASCTSDTFAGPFEFSEPEARNEQWVQTTFPNIKFAMNVHSSGGYFMWPPGAYTPARETLPYPPYGTLNYFDQTAKSVLERIRTYRGTVIEPSRTGPVTDVLYSAAGNSADEAYYNHGIIGFDFEVGAPRYMPDGTQQGPGFQPPFGPATGTTGAARLAYEGHDEGMEFADGNYALLKAALDYANDTTAPHADATGPTLSAEPIDVHFTSNEAATIRYTLDGSDPTDDSPEYKPSRPRAQPDPVTITENSTLKWIAIDFKGNRSEVKSKSYVIDSVGPTVTITNPASDGLIFTQGRPVPFEFSCADDNSGVASCEGSVPNGSLLDTSTVGVHTATVTATDNAGNVTIAERTYRVIDATNVNGDIIGNVPATLGLVMGSGISFGNIVPGLAHTYEASTTAEVTSTAGDATLSVADPSSEHTGHLVNGTFFLPQKLQARAVNGTVTDSQFEAVGSSASPLNLLSYTGPVTKDVVTVEFRQPVSSSDALRTGTYGKTLTFTLSTTTP
jgi:hypothetical protein